MIKEILHPDALLRQETRSLLVGLRIFQVNGLVSCIEVPGNDNILSLRVQTVTQREQVGIKV